MGVVDDELSTKQAREGILGAISTTMSGLFTLPDPSMDVSECLLASMELGVKSVSWAMVKNELDQWEMHGTTRGVARPHQAVLKGQGQAETCRHGPHAGQQDGRADQAEGPGPGAGPPTRRRSGQSAQGPSLH